MRDIFNQRGKSNTAEVRAGRVFGDQLHLLMSTVQTNIYTRPMIFNNGMEFARAVILTFYLHVENINGRSAFIKNNISPFERPPL